MEGLNLPLNFGETDSERLRHLVHRMGEFVALYEAAEAKMHNRERQIDQSLERSESHVDDQLTRIRELLSEYERLMTEAGVARWRIAAENSLREGKEHLHSMETIIEEFRQLSNATCDRLEQATNSTVRGISDSVNSFRANDFKDMAVNSCNRVEHTASAAIKSIQNTARWFYFKKLSMVFCFSFIVAIVVGLYINSEWPWQMHANVVHERTMGKAVVQAWPELSARDQQIILTHQRMEDGAV